MLRDKAGSRMTGDSRFLNPDRVHERIDIGSEVVHRDDSIGQSRASQIVRESPHRGGASCAG